MKIILASNSPRRKQLLGKLGYEFEIIPATNEEVTNAKDARDAVKELATNKALNVFAKHGDCLVIGCDTVVDLDGTILGKPTSASNAKQMLASLSGRTHNVHTGLCVCSPNGTWVYSQTSKVTFFALSTQQIDDYVAGGSCFDKAGAYGIQDSGFVEKIEGEYDNVMGFPTIKVGEILREALH